MREIPLAPYDKGLAARVDDGDYVSLAQYKWKVSTSGYAIRNTRHPTTKRYSAIKMQEAVLGRVEGKLVDHINRVRLDNQRHNLRHATRAENNRNRGKYVADGASPYKGVFRRPSGSWAARISVNGHETVLGSYNTELEAASAYNDAAVTYHKEFAVLNDVPGWAAGHPLLANRLLYKRHGSSYYNGYGWVLQATHQGVRRYLGYYKTEDLAIEALAMWNASMPTPLDTPLACAA